MIDLAPAIKRIRALLESGTDESVTYAALEARLSLEKVCYDRLRQRHAYISHADLRGWNPNYVINTILAEVDPHIGRTMTMMIGKNASDSPEDDEFVEIGTEVGFDPTRISKMWNALANLALHVRLPRNIDDHIPEFGDKIAISAKVNEVVEELERIATGTMTFSGLGEEVSFICHCGKKNKRRASLLKMGQSVSCLNPKCAHGFKVDLRGDGSVHFVFDTIEIPCAECSKVATASRRELTALERQQSKMVKCQFCGHENRIAWTLARIA